MPNYHWLLNNKVCAFHGLKNGQKNRRIKTGEQVRICWIKPNFGSKTIWVFKTKPKRNNEYASDSEPGEKRQEREANLKVVDITSTYPNSLYLDSDIIGT